MRAEAHVRRPLHDSGSSLIVEEQRGLGLRVRDRVRVADGHLPRTSERTRE